MSLYEKPHKGRITSAYKYPLGSIYYTYRGQFLDHPQFAGCDGHTSVVLWEEGNEIETLNSRYTLVR
jgi:hypothetical protein